MSRFYRASRPLLAMLLLVLVLGRITTGAWAGPTAQAGPYHIEVTTDPGVVPATGRVKLQVKVSDASGKPVEGVVLRALTKMPGMDMGEREQQSAPVPGRTGTYQLSAQFAMEGGYESTLHLTGPLGTATAHIPLQTGQDTTTESKGPAVSPVAVTAVVAALLVVAFVLLRLKQTGQRLHGRGILNRQVLGGLLLLCIIALGASYVVGHFRREGALTPVEAQAMDMSYLPPPPGYAPVELATVTRGGVTRTVRYTGTAVGYTEQAISPRVTGTLVYQPLYVGNPVKKGQVLARLDTSQTAPEAAAKRAAENTARQGVAVAQAEVDQAQAEVGQAHAELAGKQGALAEAEAGISAVHEERDSAAAAATAAQARLVETKAQQIGATADQTYWQAQIARTAALLKAGAVSGEEYQRDRAQADNAEAKSRQAEARIMQAGADVRAAQAAVRRANAQITAAGARVQMARSELDAHFAHVRSAGAAVVTARRKIAQAESGVTEATAEAASAAATQGYAEIRAENEGVVTERVVSPGVLVAPGQTILRIAQVSPIRLQATVAEADLGRLRVGGPVTVQKDTDDGRKPVSAKITTVAPAVDAAARTGIVEAVVPNTDRRFLPGQYVVMDIATGVRSDTLHVPTRALKFRTPSSGGDITTTRVQPFLLLAESVPGGQDSPQNQQKQYTVRYVDVQTGISDGKTTEIIAGVVEGQRVVLSGGAYLKDGDTVAEITDSPPSGSGSMVVAAPASAAGNIQQASVLVTPQGFSPALIPLRAGVPARITFTRTTDKTCATEVVFPDNKITRKLPLNRAVTVEFTPKKAGGIRFVCGMNMVRGKVVVR